MSSTVLSRPERSRFGPLPQTRLKRIRGEYVGMSADFSPAALLSATRYSTWRPASVREKAKMPACEEE